MRSFIFCFFVTRLEHGESAAGRCLSGSTGLRGGSGSGMFGHFGFCLVLESF